VRRSTRHAPSEPVRSPTSPRVLLAHRPDDAGGVRDALERSGAVELARAATTARATLELFDPAWHDVVVTDELLADATGSELIRRLRDVTPGVPTVVVLRRVDPPTIAAALQAGATGVVGLENAQRDLASVVIAACSGVCAIDHASAAVLAASWPPEIDGLLSSREMDVLECLARGLTNAQVGVALYVSRETVKSHVARVLRKLEVGDRAAAVARARQVGLLPRPTDPRRLLA
jgi:DNA-binding NarL/FixJ family response regulator